MPTFQAPAVERCRIPPDEPDLPRQREGDLQHPCKGTTRNGKAPPNRSRQEHTRD